MSPAPPSKRLYLRNLPRHVNHRSLAKHLSSYGNIQEVKMVHDYAFVQFESKKDAQDVVETFRKQPFLGQDIVVEFAHPLRKHATSALRSNNGAETVPDIPLKPRFVSTNVQCRYPIVVENIPRKIRWQELKDFGRIPGGLVAYCDLDKRTQGRGFIEYFSKEDAEHAIRELDGRYLGEQRVRVSGKPEVFSRVHTRSRSPRRQARSSYYSDHREFRQTEGHARADEYYDTYYRRTPPPAYYSETAASYPYDPKRSPPRHLTTDDRSVADHHFSYAATGPSHYKYQEHMALATMRTMGPPRASMRQAKSDAILVHSTLSGKRDTLCPCNVFRFPGAKVAFSLVSQSIHPSRTSNLSIFLPGQLRSFSCITLPIAQDHVSSFASILYIFKLSFTSRTCTPSTKASFLVQYAYIPSHISARP
ncbi:hypothetical protein LshimejAT787_0105910 [Lyophyllum shimeji]|uniref:RRM domain-containing protein n=1 Tax=Lyophyllum shimeji TaxID=47721 RepID=A0A9P3PDY5_LYOSH|nr:hypothetical protein LshimejAT787_0105910 [Lyophyllum shimeji]